MAQLEDFYPHLLVEVAGCPEPLLDLHLVQAAREFCRTTLAWRAALDAIDTVAGMAAYEIDSPEGQSDIARILRVQVNGKVLWDDSEKADASRRRVAPFDLGNDNRSIVLNDAPTASAAGGLVLSGALRPTTGATGLPDFLLSEHLDAIRVGTLARLLALGGVAWRDPMQALALRRDFDQAMARAAFRADTGNTERPLRVRKWG